MGEDMSDKDDHRRYQLHLSRFTGKAAYSIPIGPL